MKTTTPFARKVFSVVLFMMIMLPFSTTPGTGASEPGLDDCLPKYPPPPVVKIKVRVPACSEPGRLIEYRICVENCSTAEAHHVTVRDTLPGNVKLVKADPAPTKQGADLQWNLGTIGGGAAREIILVVQPTNKEDVKNCARVTFEHGQCVVTRLSCLPPGARPPIIEIVPEDMPVFDLEVKGPKDQYVNLRAKYEIILTNKGKTKARNTEIRALVAEKLKVVKVSAPGVDAKNLVEWKIGDLEPGASRTVELTLQATEKGEFCFTVGAEADGGVKKEVEKCTKFAGVSAMSPEMYDSQDPVFVGEKTSYPVFIRNQGSEPLTNIQLKAFVPDALKLERANALGFEKEAPVKGGQWIVFAPLPKIDVGAQARYEIFCEAVKAGVTVFEIRITADQLEPGRPVIEQESTTIVDDREKLKIKEQ